MNPHAKPLAACYLLSKYGGQKAADTPWQTMTTVADGVKNKFEKHRRLCPPDYRPLDLPDSPMQLFSEQPDLYNFV